MDLHHIRCRYSTQTLYQSSGSIAIAEFLFTWYGFLKMGWWLKFEFSRNWVSNSCCGCCYCFVVVGGGGWWWCKVIFVWNPTFELSCGWVGSVTITAIVVCRTQWNFSKNKLRLKLCQAQVQLMLSWVKLSWVKLS